MKQYFQKLNNKYILWATDKFPYIRILLIFYLIYILVRHLSDPTYQSIVGHLNLGIHELGHFVFSWFGEFMTFLGGTLLQLLAPIYGIFNFWRIKDYFAITVCYAWLATNLFDIAVYLADARSMTLTLVAPFGAESAEHDWNYLLGAMNILHLDTTIAKIINLLGFVLLILAIIAGSYLIFLMIKNKKQNPKMKI